MTVTKLNSLSSNILGRKTPAIDAISESIRPGTLLVKSLRDQRAENTRLMAADLHQEFSLLGFLIAQAWEIAWGAESEHRESLRETVQGYVPGASEGSLIDVPVRKGELPLNLRPSEKGAITRAIHRAVDSVFRPMGPNVPGWLEGRLRPLYEQYYYRTVIGLGNVFTANELPLTAIRELENKVYESVVGRLALNDMSRQTIDSIRVSLRVANELGLSPKQAGRIIEQYIPKGPWVNAGSRYRAEIIARTEMTYAQNWATLQSYKESPAVEAAVAFDGEDFDEDCAERNGETFTLQEAEDISAGTHPNCVLAWGPSTERPAPQAPGDTPFNDSDISKLEKDLWNYNTLRTEGKAPFMEGRAAEPNVDPDVMGLGLRNAMKDMEKIMNWPSNFSKPKLKLKLNPKPKSFANKGEYDTHTHWIMINKESAMLNVPFEFEDTLLHESGHALDNYLADLMLERATGRLATELWEKGYGGPDFEGHYLFPYIKNVMRTIERSECYDELVREDSALFGSSGEYAHYSRASWECFARAYSQYIIEMTHTPPSVTIGDLQAFARGPGRNQWTHYEFEPIKKAMDELVTAAGWRR